MRFQGQGGQGWNPRLEGQAGVGGTRGLESSALSSSPTGHRWLGTLLLLLVLLLVLALPLGPQSPVTEGTGQV